MLAPSPTHTHTHAHTQFFLLLLSSVPAKEPQCRSCHLGVREFGNLGNKEDGNGIEEYGVLLFFK